MQRAHYVHEGAWYAAMRSASGRWATCTRRGSEDLRKTRPKPKSATEGAHMRTISITTEETERSVTVSVPRSTNSAASVNSAKE